MIILGLAGPAGTGKDTVADYLVERYGFVKFSFSDALYREVTEAFGLDTDDLLRDRRTKEVPAEALALNNCQDDEFYLAVLRSVLLASIEDDDAARRPRSPRQILQWWGTEYRRAQDPDYWINAAQDWMFNLRDQYPYAETRPQLFVNTSVRFPNEREWIDSFEDGSVWHIRRAGLAPVHAHESETPLPVMDYDREIWNNAGLDQLYRGVDLLLSTNARFVKCEPMKPMVEPEQYQAGGVTGSTI